MPTPMTKIREWREEWNNYCKEDMDTREGYANWWINRFQQELEKLEGEIEGIKNKNFPRMGYTGETAVREKVLSDVLEIIRQHKEG